MPVGRHHTYLPNEKALALKPNLHYKPLNPLSVVPEWLGHVIALPDYHPSQNSGDTVLNLHLLYWKIFEKKIHQAMEPSTSPATKTRRRADTSLTRSSNPQRRTKSSSNQGGAQRKAESDQASTSSQSTCYTLQPGLSKIRKVQLKLKHCQQPGTKSKATKQSRSPLGRPADTNVCPSHLVL